MKSSDRIRQFAGRQYVEPVRGNVGAIVKIRSGDIVKGMGLKNKTPNVCTALRSRRFQQEYGLELIGEQGPPSGMSTTVVFTYKVLPSAAPATPKSFKSIRGIAKEVFESLGGGEEFIRQQREGFFGNNDSHREGGRA
jgi:hypothetical protein